MFHFLNNKSHLAQQLTPNDEVGLCFGGAAVLSSLFNGFLKQFQLASIKAVAFVHTENASI